MELRYSIKKAQHPIIAAAIHDGHLIDQGLHPYLNLKEHERFREEDPYTDYLATLPVSHITVQTSRFQLDLNRARSDAVYRTPGDAWGLQLWKTALPDVLVAELLQHYDAFYAQIASLLEDTIKRFGHFVVLDIHSYNHRRDDPDTRAAAQANPEINIGTAHNQEEWKTFGQHFARFLRHHRIMGHRADVRENVKFGGGGFSEWINKNYGEYGCVLSLEFKKLFMDEWTGRVNMNHLHDLKQMLTAAIPFLLDALDERQHGEENDS